VTTVTAGPFYAEYRRRLLGPWTDIKFHLPRLYRTAAAYPRVRVLELGTRRGESTRAFLAAAELTGGHVWSVDIDQPQVPVEEWEASGLWTLTVDDDLTVVFPIGTDFDVLFIDTSHEYEHTLQELERWSHLVQPGGVILMHDTEWEPPAVQLPGPTGPVAVALDDWCHETGRSWRNWPGSYGLGQVDIA
jgi:predicted O-methyltransferase YrrM